MTKPLATLALAATATIVACSSKPTHPGAAAECSTGIDCTGIGGPIGGGGPVGGGDASTGDTAVTEGGPGTLSVPSGTVTSPASFTTDPATSPLDSGDTTLVVQALQNGVVVNAPVTAGVFSFTNIDNDAPGLTEFILQGRNTAIGGVGNRTLFYTFIDGSVTTLSSLAIPAYDPAMIASTEVTLGIPTTAEVSAGVFVYQLLDSSGAPIVGAHVTNPNIPDAGTTATACPVGSAGTTGPCGPYYDSGDNVEFNSAGTGPHGTAAFFAVPAGSFRADVTLPSGTGVVMPSFAIGDQTVTLVRVALAAK